MSSKIAAKYYPSLDPDIESTVLFDIVAAYLAVERDNAGGLMSFQECALNINQEGFTEWVDDGAAPSAVCALEWREGGMEKFAFQVVQTLLSTGQLPTVS